MLYHRQKLALSVLKTRKVYNPQNFQMLTSHSLLTIKGAPDVLIGRCTKYTTMEGESKVLDDATRTKIEAIKNIWSSKGRRVILLARKRVSKEQIRALPSSSQFEDEVSYHAREGLTLVGLVGIVDPPRDEIPSVVKILRGAGIRIFMVRRSSYSQQVSNLLSGHRGFCIDSSSYRN